LREEVGVERGLKSLRDDIEAAKSEVPRVPEIAAKLERGQERLRRELETAKDKLKRVRVDQIVADFRLKELDKKAARAMAVEAKVETTVATFKMQQVHPAARETLRNFAAEAFKGEKIWLFDPNLRAGTVIQEQ
jgi:hypothetical protein